MVVHHVGLRRKDAPNPTYGDTFTMEAPRQQEMETKKCRH